MLHTMFTSWDESERRCARARHYFNTTTEPTCPQHKQCALSLGVVVLIRLRVWLDAALSPTPAATSSLSTLPLRPHSRTLHRPVMVYRAANSPQNTAINIGGLHLPPEKPVCAWGARPLVVPAARRAWSVAGASQHIPARATACHELKSGAVWCKKIFPQGASSTSLQAVSCRHPGQHPSVGGLPRITHHTVPGAAAPLLEALFCRDALFLSVAVTPAPRNKYCAGVSRLEGGL